MMRAKYYYRCIRQMKGKKSFVFLLVIFLFIFLFAFMYLSAMPVIESFCKSKARYIALDSTNKSIYENIDGIKYEDLVKVERDEKNKVVSLSANTVMLTKLSTKISSDIKEKIAEIGETEVNVPITSILGIKMFGMVGPKLNLKLIPSGSVKAVFKSNFEEAGINQVRNRIYLEVITKVSFLAPFVIQAEEFKNEVNIVEAILVGDVPATYYSINGIEELDEKDTMEFVQ